MSKIDTQHVFKWNNHFKETLGQTQVIANLKQMCMEQEKTIEALRQDLNSIKNVGESQLEGQQSEVKLAKKKENKTLDHLKL